VGNSEGQSRGLKALIGCFAAHAPLNATSALAMTVFAI
jgi:hypothetical protein